MRICALLYFFEQGKTSVAFYFTYFALVCVGAGVLRSLFYQRVQLTLCECW